MGGSCDGTGGMSPSIGYSRGCWVSFDLGIALGAGRGACYHG